MHIYGAKRLPESFQLSRSVSIETFPVSIGKGKVFYVLTDSTYEWERTMFLNYDSWQENILYNIYEIQPHPIFFSTVTLKIYLIHSIKHASPVF
jgi:hypothetical protein